MPERNSKTVHFLPTSESGAVFVRYAIGATQLCMGRGREGEQEEARGGARRAREKREREEEQKERKEERRGEERKEL